MESKTKVFFFKVKHKRDIFNIHRWILYSWEKMGNVSYNGYDESGGEIIFQSFSILFFLSDFVIIS